MKVLLSYSITPQVMPDFLRAQGLQHEKFPDAIRPYDTLVISRQLEDPENFCLAALRNEAILHAITHNYDWLILFDADSVLIHEINQWPPSGFGTCPLYRASPGQSDFPFTPDTHFGNSSWYVLSREVFAKHRFCESYLGFGWEDYDFTFVELEAHGIEKTPCDAHAIHVWHQRRTQIERFEINKTLFQKRYQVRPVPPVRPVRQVPPEPHA